MTDYDPETGALIVRGKGNKERNAYIDDGAAEAMGEWLKVRGVEPGPLFCPITQLGAITVRRMSDQAVYAILQSRAKQRKYDPSPPMTSAGPASRTSWMPGSTSRSFSSSSATQM